MRFNGCVFGTSCSSFPPRNIQHQQCLMIVACEENGRQAQNMPKAAGHRSRPAWRNDANGVTLGSAVLGFRQGDSLRKRCPPRSDEVARVVRAHQNQIVSLILVFDKQLCRSNRRERCGSSHWRRSLGGFSSILEKLPLP